MKRILFGLSGLILLLAGCSTFVNDAQKSLYSAAMLSDGAMKSYAIYWKWETNRLGDTPALELQRSNAMAYSVKVGSSLAVATKALNDYSNNVGTNYTTQTVVNALIQTAIQDAGSIPGEISLITGNPSWSTSTP